MTSRTSLRAQFLPPCTCRPTVPTRRYASALVATASPLPAPANCLDFLYPTFGFFSRSLPPALNPILPPAPVFDRTIRKHLGSGYSIAIAPRAFPGVKDRCVCGRAQYSCLRCRPSSSSAYGAIKDVEGDVDTLVELVPPSPASVPTPTPPILLSNPSPHRKKSSTSLAQSFAALSSSLPSVRTHIDTKRQAPKSPFPSSSPPTPWTLTALERAGDTYWISFELSQGQEAAVNQLTDEEQLDAIRIFARLVRAMPLISSTVGTGRERSARRRTEHRMERFRKLQGERMELLLDATRVGRGSTHSRSKATLYLDSSGLRDALPLTPSPPSTDSDLLPSADRYGLALSTIFSPSAAALLDPIKVNSINNAMESTLSNLFEAWKRSPDGPAQALNLILGWDLEKHLKLRVDNLGKTYERSTFLDLLRRSYGELLARMQPSPSGWYDLFSGSGRSKEAKQVGLHLIYHLSITGFELDALKVLKVMRLRGISLVPREELSTTTALLEGLLRGGLVEDANAIVRDLAPSSLFDLPALSSPSVSPTAIVAQQSQLTALRAAVKVVAQRGRSAQVDRWTRELNELSPESPLAGISRRMRSFSALNALEDVRAAFDLSENQILIREARKRDQVRLYGELIRAYTRVDDVAGGMTMLERLIKEGLRPNLAIINSLLFGFAHRADRERTYALFDRLATFQLSPDVVSYTALVSLHGNARDPEAAQVVIRELEGKGMAANLRIWTTMMNVYVEVGSWGKAVEIYEFLDRHQDPSFRPDIATFNVLLKANVLLSTPAQTVFALFRRTLEQGLRPNAQTYTLLMQSVCTAGMMDVAEELFTLMDQPHSDNRLQLPTPAVAIEPDAFIFSILVRGYLARGDTTKAKACLSEMQARGISPSSVTYGIIVGSYLRSSDAGGLDTARALAKDFLESSPLEESRHKRLTRYDNPLARGQELLNVFGPIINAYAKQDNADLALQYFKQVIQQDVQPSIPLYTSLMDAYRGIRQPSSVKYLWNHIHQLVLSTYPASPSLDTLPTERPSFPPNTDAVISKVNSDHRNMLCLPFSVYINSLADANAHSEIASAWQTLTEEGFAFDSGNWNSLAVALVQDGQLERAFWISEYILCPPDEESDAKRSGEVGGDLDKSLSTDITLRLPSRVYQNREGERAASRRSSASLLEQLTPSEAVDEDYSVEEEEEERPDELIPSIFTSQAVLRSHYWFPHGVLLRSLERALYRLSAFGGGSIVRASWDRDGNLIEEKEQLTLDPDEAESLREKLRVGHPKTFTAIGMRQNAINRRKEN